MDADSIEMMFTARGQTHLKTPLDPHKPVEKMVSSKPIPTSASLEASVAAYKLALYGQDIYDFVMAADKITGPLIPWEFQALMESAAAQGAMRAVEAIRDHDYAPKLSGRRNNAVIHVPTYTALHHALLDAKSGARVLLIGPSPKEVKRFNNLVRMQFPNKVFHVRALVKTGSKRVATDLDIQYDQCSTYREYFESTYGTSTFDVVILPFTMGDFFETELPRAQMAELLRSRVSRGGLVLGLFYDTDASRQIHNANVHEAEFGPVVVADNPNMGTEGCVCVKWDDRTFDDYRFTPEGLDKLVKDSDHSELYAARHYMKNIHAPLKELMRKALDPRLEPIRIFRWRMDCVDKVFLPENLQWKDWAGAIVQSDVDVSMTAGYFHGCRANRGKPFSAEDVMWMVPDRIFVTPKADGYEGILAFDNHRAGHLVIRGQPKEFKVPWVGPPGLVLHLEILGMSPSVEHIAGAVLADVLHGIPDDLGFYGRMECARRLFYGWGLPIKIPPLVKLTSEFLFPQSSDLGSYPVDGFVLNYDAAPAIVARDGFGPARYLKYSYTIEVAGDDGKIYEADMNGSIIHDDEMRPKLRPDKTDPTPDEVVAFLREAWTIPQFVDRMRAAGHRPASLSRILDPANPVPSQRDGYKFTDEELIYLGTPWRNREFEAEVFLTRGGYARDLIYPSIRRGFHDLALRKGILPPPVVIPKETKEEALASLRAIGDIIEESGRRLAAGLDVAPFEFIESDVSQMICSPPSAAAMSADAELQQAIARAYRAKYVQK